MRVFNFPTGEKKRAIQVVHNDVHGTNHVRTHFEKGEQAVLALSYCEDELLPTWIVGQTRHHRGCDEATMTT